MAGNGRNDRVEGLKGAAPALSRAEVIDAVKPPRLFACAVLVVLAGCATMDRVQRATEGPTADEIWRARFVRSYGRLPTFDEASAWEGRLDQRVSDFLTRHPEIATSARVSLFRFHRRVSVGMTREEVTLLVEGPDSRTTDQAAMEATAKQFWPEIKQRAREMWLYPGGWQLYFDGDHLVDLTVVGRRRLQ
jgi:hypothetical protein